MPRRKNPEVAKEQMTIDEFLSLFQPMKMGKTDDGGIVRLYNPHVVGHLLLKKYKVDLFSSVFSRVTINRFQNVIKFWVFGIRKRVKDTDGFHYEYHYTDPPRYEIHGLLKDGPEENEY